MKSKKLLIAVLAVMMIAAFCFTGCGGSGESEEAAAPEVNEYGLADNTYVATFTTDNGMFHVNEANNNKGILTVENGEMTIHVSLAGKGILNLYPGLAEDAQKEGAVLLEPTTESEEVYGFDVAVPYLDKEFDLALVGTKGTWYDHKVMVSDPVEGDDIHAGTEMNLENGEYNVELTLEGGSGKATVESPAKLVVENGEVIIVDQFTIKCSTFNKETRAQIPNDFGYIVERGNATLVKLLDFYSEE